MLLSLVLLAQFFMPAQEQVTSVSGSPIEVLEVEVLMREVKANRIRDPRATPPPGPARNYSAQINSRRCRAVVRSSEAIVGRRCVLHTTKRDSCL